MSGFFASLLSALGNVGDLFTNSASSFHHFPAAIKGVATQLKGRTYLFVSAIVVIVIAFSALLAEGVENWKEGERRVGAQMLTSGQATTPDMFEYLIDTGAGRTLAEGEFSTEDSCVTLPGGEYRGCFAAVEESREDYVTRIEYYECGTDKAPQTCSRTVQEWQNTGTERVQATRANLLGVDIPYDFARNRLRDADVSELREPNTGGFLRSNSHYFYESGTVRYSYNVADNNYYGTLWLDLSAEEMKRLGGFWQNQTIEQVLEAHTGEPVGPVVVHWVVQILLLVAGLVGIGMLVSRDLGDGEDHTF